MDEKRIEELYRSGRLDRRAFLRMLAVLASGGVLTALSAAPASASRAAVTSAGVPANAAATASTAARMFPYGELRIAQASNLDTLDVHATRGGLTRALLANAMDGLKRRLHTGEWVPHLVKSMERVDELTYKFHLQENVEFTNGDKFNASVLAYNFKRFADPATGTMYGGTKFTQYHKSCDVLDEYTVKWTTQTPLGAVLEFIPDAFLMMSPKAIAELGKDIANKAVGTGPFKVTEWTPNERLVFEANEKCWLGAPRVAKVTWRPIPEAATRIVELKTGRVDVIDAVPAERIPELQQTKGIQIVRAPNEMSAYIQLNCAKEPFNNVKVRQALNHAINRDAIVKGVMFGAAEPQVGFLSPAHEGYDPNLKPYAYDPDKARQLLEQAGYSKGFRFTLAGPSARYYKDKEILQAVASQLEAIGLTVDLKISEWGTYIGEFIKKPPVFDAAMIGYGDGGNAFTALNMSVYSKANAAGYYGYQNPDFDSLYEKAMGISDAIERAELMRQMRQILYDEAPFIYVVTQQVIYAIRDYVHDFYPLPEGNFWLREGDGVYVDQT